MFFTLLLVLRMALLGMLLVLFPGCGRTFLQSRSVAKPFAADSRATCSSLRQDLFLLRSGLRTPDVQLKRQRAVILANLSLQEHAKNIKHVSTPREKMGLLITSELLINEKEIWEFIESVDKLDILGIVCRDLEETISPGLGEGIAHADFHRVGEDFLAYLVFKDDELYLILPPNNEQIDTYDRETILSLIGHASKSAVHEGVKAAIP